MAKKWKNTRNRILEWFEDVFALIKENRKILSTIERLASEINANTQETKSLREDVNSIGDRMNKLEQDNISEDAD